VLGKQPPRFLFLISSHIKRGCYTDTDTIQAEEHRRECLTTDTFNIHFKRVQLGPYTSGKSELLRSWSSHFTYMMMAHSFLYFLAGGHIFIGDII